MRIETRFTRLVGVDLPIMQAGMSWASSNAALPIAVSRAGGLGVIAAGPMRLPALADAIDETRAAVGERFAVNIPLYRQGAAEVLDLLAEKKVPILVASQGGTKPYLDRFKALGAICIHVVAGQDHALKAAAAGADGLVVVGGEAGGHPPAELVSTLVAVRGVVRALGGRVPVVAAGGFADGAGLAAALSLGADAAGFGTRFIATPEANVHPSYKDAVLAAASTDTRAVGRGLGMIRTLANAFTERMAEAETAGLALEERRVLFAAHTLKMAALDGDMAGGKAEAGQSVGLVDDIVPAGELVARIAKEYLEARRSLPPRTE